LIILLLQGSAIKAKLSGEDFGQGVGAIISGPGWGGS
jgi:hypothetical protein